MRNAGTSEKGDKPAFETRAARRQKVRDARRGIVGSPGISPQRERINRRILGWIFKGFHWPLMLAAAFGLHTAVEEIRDPHIDLWGEVMDEEGRRIPGATVEWSTWRDGNSWRYVMGKDVTDERGVFRVYEKRMRGDGITVHRISANGYRQWAESRSFRFFKDPWRIEPDDRESATFVLKKRAR